MTLADIASFVSVAKNGKYCSTDSGLGSKTGTIRRRRAPALEMTNLGSKCEEITTCHFIR